MQSEIRIEDRGVDQPAEEPHRGGLAVGEMQDIDAGDGGDDVDADEQEHGGDPAIDRHREDRPRLRRRGGAACLVSSGRPEQMIDREADAAQPEGQRQHDEPGGEDLASCRSGR